MRAHYLQHVPSEGLAGIEPWLDAYGYEITHSPLFESIEFPNMDEFDLLIVMGGPMSVNDENDFAWLAPEKQFINRAVKSGKPVLGVCLGAQLIADSLGARVYPNREKEIGWFDISLTANGKTDPLFSDFEKTEKVFQWHGDTFSIPKGATHLAQAPTCHNQAFRYRDNVYGLQFHLEVDTPMVERWLKLALLQKKREIEEADAQTIKKETKKYMRRNKELGKKMFSKWIQIFGSKKRRVVLGSRRVKLP